MFQTHREGKLNTNPEIYIFLEIRTCVMFDKVYVTQRIEYTATTYSYIYNVRVFCLTPTCY